MSIAIEAVWESGVFTPKTRPDLPEKTNVTLIVETPAKSTLEADLRRAHELTREHADEFLERWRRYFDQQ